MKFSQARLEKLLRKRSQEALTILIQLWVWTGSNVRLEKYLRARFLMEISWALVSFYEHNPHSQWTMWSWNISSLAMSHSRRALTHSFVAIADSHEFFCAASVKVAWATIRFRLFYHQFALISIHKPATSNKQSTVSHTDFGWVTKTLQKTWRKWNFCRARYLSLYQSLLLSLQRH